MLTRKKVGKAILFVLLTLAVRQVLCFFLVDDIHVGTRVALRELYADAGRIDTLFLGASHCENGIIPDAVDEKLGVFSFNLATPGQPANVSYYLLKEAGAQNPLKTVYLEMFYSTFAMEGPEGAERHYLCVTDFMDPRSPNRYRLLAEAGGVDCWRKCSSLCGSILSASGGIPSFGETS